MESLPDNCKKKKITIIQIIAVLNIKASLTSESTTETLVDSWKNDNEHTDNCCFIGCTAPMNVLSGIHLYMHLSSVTLNLMLNQVKML